MTTRAPRSPSAVHAAPSDPPTTTSTFTAAEISSNRRNRHSSATASQPSSSALHPTHTNVMSPHPPSPRQRPSLRPSPYPLPYPAAYPPFAPHVTPASQALSLDRPHRYVVCRTCSTIILVLRNLPTSVSITRHFSDATPVSATQTFRTPSNPGSLRPSIHKADALAWLRKPFSGLLSYNDSADQHSSRIPLACRTCHDPDFATLLLVFDVVQHPEEKPLRKVSADSIPDSHHEDAVRHGRGENGTGQYSCAYLTFRNWAVLFSDAYGREILAAAEAQGFWNFTPAPYAARSFRWRLFNLIPTPFFSICRLDWPLLGYICTLIDAYWID